MTTLVVHADSHMATNPPPRPPPTQVHWECTHQYSTCPVPEYASSFVNKP